MQAKYEQIQKFHNEFPQRFLILALAWLDKCIREK